MFRNESDMDRTVRAQAGGALILVGALAWAMGNTVIAWAIAPGLIFLATGLIGFCPLYTALGINTAKKNK